MISYQSMDRQMSGSANVRIGKCPDWQMSGSANVWIGKCLDIKIGKSLDRQMSGSANVRIGKCLHTIGKCLVCKCLGLHLSSRQKLVGRCRPAKVRPHYVRLPLGRAEKGKMGPAAWQMKSAQNKVQWTVTPPPKSAGYSLLP